MAFCKVVLALCASALFVQACPNAARAGCGCGSVGAGLGYNGLAGAGLGYNGLGYAGRGGCGGVASTGGGLPVSSASCSTPNGISVLSENAYEGSLNVGGNLPFLGTVSLEGVLPTAGAGSVNYGCGNGAVGITSEGPIGTGIITPETYGPGVGAFNNYGSGLAGIGGYGAGFGGYGAGFGGYGAGLAGRAGYGLGARGGCGCGCGAY